MIDRSFLYTVEPKKKQVNKEKFLEFIKNYPRPLNRDVFGACEPPAVSYNDFALANRWPYSIVASTFLYDAPPDSPYYVPEDEREYVIIENYEELFASKTGNEDTK